MTRETVARAARLAAGCTGMILLLGGGALSQGQPATAPPAEKPTGDVTVNVTLADGREFKECRVVLRDRIVTLGKGEARAVATGVPAERMAATADARVRQGWFKPDLRYVGVQEVSVIPNRMNELTLTLGPVEDVDVFCRSCHPGKGDPVAPGQIPRDAHASGVVLDKEKVKQVGIYNDRVEKLVKEGKPHPQPLVVEEREVIENGKKVKRTFATCESCHTLHLWTANGKYAIASFRRGGTLCLGCHK